MPISKTDATAINLSRRLFVQGLVGACALGGLGPWLPATARSITPKYGPATLRGNAFDLAIAELPVNFTGRQRHAIAVNGTLPGPTLHWREGEEVTIRVRNRLGVASSIHWHGILLPADMDGVPGLSFAGIPAGGEFTYRFRVRQSGTYWYHSHSGFQEQSGLYGAIVIDPAGGPRPRVERDYVVMLNDWSDDNPEHIFRTLKRAGDYYNRALPDMQSLMHDARRDGLDAALAARRMWNRMRMNRTDYSDVGGGAYTYLLNGHTPAANWEGLFARGDKVRLRFINGSAMTIFDVRIPGLKMTVVAADGQDVEPVSIDEFRLSVAETLDVIIAPADDRAWTIFAQAIDRSGFAAGTLTPRAGLRADVPRVDALVPLAMADMMGAMSHVADHGAHDMSGMGGMDMTAPVVRHAASERNNPGVDMLVDTPRTNLDDPGAGLRDNGRHVLTYSDLHTLGGPLDAREPGRDIELHLTGNMHRYQWSFDGIPYADAKPIHFRAGERLRLVIVNDTMMNHPIHLHGMWSEVEDAHGAFQVRKHTVNVQPAQRMTWRVSADPIGAWAMHCHLLYHMEGGMMREVLVT